MERPHAPDTKIVDDSAPETPDEISDLTGTAGDENAPPAASPARLLGGFVAIVAVLLLSVLGWNAVAAGRAAKASGAPSREALADAPTLLSETMKRYAALDTFQADYTWRLGAGGEQHGPGDGHDHGPNDGHDHPAPAAAAPGEAPATGHEGHNHNHAQPENAAPGGTSAKRTLVYAKPNKFRVVSDDGGFRLVSVSDGARVAEYTNSPTLPGRVLPAPATLASEQSPLLQHPMFCATLLHRFFAGPDGLAQLVDLTKSGGPAGVRFGPDVTVAEQPCKTLVFPALGVYGNAEVAVGTKDGLIRRIRYDSEPLVEELKRRNKGQPVPPMQTEELYTRVAPNQAAPADAFDTTLPAGIKPAAPRAAAPAKTPADKAGAPNKPAAAVAASPITPGSPAPAFAVTGLSGNGAKTSLAGLRGKVVLVDFWATWCQPCRRGLPETLRLHQKYANKGLAVLAVSNEDTQTVQTFLRENKAFAGLPVYRDAGEAALSAYQVDALPTVAIIDRQGRLSSYLVGLQEPATLQAALKKAGLNL